MDEVLIGAPYPLTEEVLDHFNVDLVVQGKVLEGHQDHSDHFAVARQRGIFKVGSDFWRNTHLTVTYV